MLGYDEMGVSEGEDLWLTDVLIEVLREFEFEESQLRVKFGLGGHYKIL